MTEPSQGGDNMDAGTILTIVSHLGLMTQRGTNYVSAYHAGQKLIKASQTRPSVPSMANCELPTFTQLQDGTSRISIYDGGDDMTVAPRKGSFQWNISTRFICACNDENKVTEALEGGSRKGLCIAKNGESYGQAAGDFTGSKCGHNHPKTPFMPTIEVREGTEFHRTLRLYPSRDCKVGMPLFDGTSVKVGYILTQRVGGGHHGLNADSPQYRRNVWFGKRGCPSCGKEQCWGTNKKTESVCFPAYEFAWVNVEGRGWVHCSISPSSPTYSLALSVLDSMGSKVSDRPFFGPVSGGGDE